MTKRWNLLLLLLLHLVFVRAAVMKDEEFKTYLKTLDRRPPAQRVARLVKLTPDPWDRSDASLADEILGNIRKEADPPDELERMPVKSIDEDRRGERLGNAKNELKPRSILRRPKTVTLVDPSVIERAMTL